MSITRRQIMPRYDYDAKDSANTATHLAVDEKIRQSLGFGDSISFEEGFAAESGVRQETAETGGRVRHAEDKDAPITKSADDMLEEESISDLADPVLQTESL
jgi:hypothetical protein